MVMTMHNREHDVTAAMEAGVHGYLLQGCSIERPRHGREARAGAVQQVHRSPPGDHRRNREGTPRAIFSKLDAGSRTGAVGIATRRGLIDEPMRSHPVLMRSRPALPMTSVASAA